ncbi:MAG: ABC transporter ATP-binding protein [Pirellulaceae bacterium]|nr:ABC transporter ATP-binding protein [Pirellulaceae bacterium]
MISRQQRQLLERVGGVPSLALASMLGCIAAATVPIVFLLCGVIVDILAAPAQAAGKRFGQFLPNLRSWLPADLSPLAQVSLTLAIALGIVLLQVVCLYLFYRRIQVVAVELEAAVMERMWDHSRRLAVVRTLSGQQTALVDGLEYHLPRVRASLSRWWRASPRHIVQLVACLVLACLITPLLALLTIVAAAIVILVYRTLDRYRRTRLPVVRERATQRRHQVMALSLQGPLLESVHTDVDIQANFREQLAAYRKEAVRSLASSAWKTPLVLALAGLLSCLFVFLVSIQILRAENNLTLAGCLTFLLCCAGVAVSAIRLQRSGRELRSVQTASEDLLRFLSLPADTLPVIEARQPKLVSRDVTLEHVTVQDSSGRKLLENVSTQFVPGKLYGVVATQRLQASALMELLLGIGRPVSGRMLIDDTSVSDIEPAALKRLGIWVADSGPLVTASVESNLLGDGKTSQAVNLMDALRAARATDAVQRLPDAAATLVTPGDDRFLPDTPFRLGIARARLREASIIVLEEPAARVDNKTEQETIEAIRSLVNSRAITVLLPQRLTTLRQCDQIILLHEHQIADTGTHAELLQRCDLYRHLNYVRFSPLRHVTV